MTCFSFLACLFVSFDLANLIALASCVESTSVTHFLLLFLHLGTWTWFSALKWSRASIFLNPNQCKIWRHLFPMYFLLEPTANDPRYLLKTFSLYPEIVQSWAPALWQYLPCRSPPWRAAASCLLTGPLLTMVPAAGKVDRVYSCCPPQHVLWTKIKRCAFGPSGISFRD